MTMVGRALAGLLAVATVPTTAAAVETAWGRAAIGAMPAEQCRERARAVVAAATDLVPGEPGAASVFARSEDRFVAAYCLAGQVVVMAAAPAASDALGLIDRIVAQWQREADRPLPAGPALASETHRRALLPDRCSITARYLRLAEDGPAAAAFAAAMRRVAVPRDAERCPDETARARGVFNYAAGYEVTLSAPQLVAVTFTIDRDSAGAAPIHVTRAVTFDLARRRVLALGDVMDVGRGLPVIAAECQRQIDDATRQRGEPLAEIDDDVRAAVRDMAHWSIEPGRVRFRFDGLAAGGSARGDVDCAIPLAALSPFLPADSPLRPLASGGEITLPTIAIGLALGPLGNTAAPQDCGNIRRAVERLICADAALRAADASMVQAYDALRERSDAPTRRRLLEAQRSWLALRARVCDAFWDHGDNDQAPCLVGMTQRRRAALAAGRIVGEIVEAPPGAPALLVETEVLGDPRRRCAVNVRYPRLAGPAPDAAVFNDAIRRTVNDPLFVQYGGGLSTYRRCPAGPRDFPYYEYNLDFRVTLHTARVIAVAFGLYFDPGNAHPLGIERSVIVDLARRRVLAIADLIEPTGLPVIEQECRRRIEQEYEVDYGAPDATLPLERFAAIVRTISAWTITPSELRIAFPPSAILPGPARSADCTIPLAVLRPHLAASSPLR